MRGFWHYINFVIMETQIIINMNELNKYRELKEQGYKTLWVGEGKICLVR